MQLVTVKVRVCIRCKLPKPHNLFVKRHGKYRFICLDCNNSASKVKYKKYDGKNRANQASQKRRQRVHELWSKLQSGVCSKCGQSDSNMKFISDSDELKISYIINWGPKHLLEVIKDYQLICTNCYPEIRAAILAKSND